MAKYKKYFPVLGILLGFALTKMKITNEWLEIVAVVIGVILLFEFFEATKMKRAKNVNTKSRSKYSHILKFSLILGFPISIAITFIISKNAELLYSILFIVIPLVLIFGWIGLLDWRDCQKKFLESKYNVEL